MSIKRNTVYNVAGALVPLITTIVTVPRYLHIIGDARYGVIALVWLVFGYFGLLDLGLSTATANAVARLRGRDDAKASSTVVTSLTINAALGSIAGILVFALGATILPRLSLDRAMAAEIRDALPWLALLCPFITVGGVFSGVLTAHDRFLSLNLLGVVGTVLSQAGPLIVAARFGASLRTIILVTVIIRVAMILTSGIMAKRHVSLKLGRFDGGLLRDLLSYGGWVMVTNLIAPILVSADQFIIASLLGASSIAHYSIAYSLAIRLLILPSAFIQTLFPVLSRLSGEEARDLAVRSTNAMAMIMTTLALPAILLSGPFLDWWLGIRVGTLIAPVAQVLLVSTWINGLAYIPYSLLQAQGRPNRVATFHLIEVVPFLIALFAGIHYLGLLGAALAWGARVLLDAVLLFGSTRLLSGNLLQVPAAFLLLVGSCVVAHLLAASAFLPILLAVASGVGLGVFSLFHEPLLRDWVATLAGRTRWSRWIVGLLPQGGAG